MKLGTLLIRAVVGPLFVGHGTQKLYGWFGGPGLEGTGGFFESLGLRPGRRHATVAGIAEAGGGALLTLGLLTPLATTAITATMLTAIRKVHAPNGPWVANNGFEYNAVLIAVMAGLAEHGPGPVSLDAQLAPHLHGPAFALGGLAAAAAASYLATSDVLNEPEPMPEPPFGPGGEDEAATTA